MRALRSAIPVLQITMAVLFASQALLHEAVLKPTALWGLRLLPRLYFV
jgi:hypothetical protein